MTGHQGVHNVHPGIGGLEGSEESRKAPLGLWLERLTLDQFFRSGRSGSRERQGRA